MSTNTTTLFEALSSIPDHRTRKGRRYPLAAILAITIAAMLSGANDLRAVFRWGRRLSPKALQALGIDKKRKKAPCHATYHYVFKELSLGNLTRALGCTVQMEDAPDDRLNHPAQSSGSIILPSMESACEAPGTETVRACISCTPSRPDCRRRLARWSCRRTPAR